MVALEAGVVLARFARARIRESLGGPPAAPPSEVLADRATFVSLHWPDGRLQGCIGSLEPRRATVDDVAANAVAAALSDPRAAPLSLADVETLEVEVSILSPLEPLAARSEAEACALLRPFVDGVVLRWHKRRATFLPQVWDHLRDPVTFLGELRRKAGLAPDFWDDALELDRYTVDIVRDVPGG